MRSLEGEDGAPKENVARLLFLELPPLTLIEDLGVIPSTIKAPVNIL